MNWYVESRFFDNGKVEAEVWSYYEIDDKTPYKETEYYDRYVDGFDTWEEANKFRNDALNA